MKQMTSMADMRFKAMKNRQDLQANAVGHQQKMEHARQESLYDMVDRMAKSKDERGRKNA